MQLLKANSEPPLKKCLAIRRIWCYFRIDMTTTEESTTLLIGSSWCCFSHAAVIPSHDVPMQIIRDLLKLSTIPFHLDWPDSESKIKYLYNCSWFCPWILPICFLSEKRLKRKERHFLWCNAPVVWIPLNTKEAFWGRVGDMSAF